MSSAKRPAPAHPIAIIGGGLCSLALATALTRHFIPFTIYEARSSFSEIGAGINLGPNGLNALRLIKPSLGEKIYSLATRNPPPDEDTWMWFRSGTANAHLDDGEVIEKLYAPGTGSLTLHRQEFLAALAEQIPRDAAEFGKKFVRYEQRDGEEFVRIAFEDGSEEKCSVLVGCDGIHSRVRVCMFGEENPVSRPVYNHDGAYRAVIPMEKAIEALGESARQSQAIFGPNGYIIYYPVNGGTAVNCGAWILKPEPCHHDDWVISDQGEQFRTDMKAWGPRMQRLLENFDSSPAFWYCYQHILQPEQFTDGRVILIGDAAHSMPPHQGAGSSQAAEDAYILAEVLSSIDGDFSTRAVSAALQATMAVRQPRFSMVQRFSTEAGPKWGGFIQQNLRADETKAWFEKVKARFEQIWAVNMAQEAEKAREILSQLLVGS